MVSTPYVPPWHRLLCGRGTPLPKCALNHMPLSQDVLASMYCGCKNWQREEGVGEEGVEVEGRGRKQETWGIRAASNC